MLNNKGKSSRSVKLIELYYADLFHARIHLKINKQILSSKLEEYEGRALFNVE